MSFYCLLDWDGTLRRGVTTLDFVRHCARYRGELDIYAEKIESLLSPDAGIHYDEIIRQVSITFFEAVRKLDRSILLELEDSFIAESLNLYDYSIDFLHQLTKVGFNVFIVSGGPETIVRKAVSRFVPERNICGLSYKIERETVVGIQHANFGTYAGKAWAAERLLGQRKAHLAVGDAPADAALFAQSILSVLLVEHGNEKRFGYFGSKPSFVVQKTLFSKFMNTVIDEARDPTSKLHETAFISA